MTWLLVSTSPELLITMPVASAFPPAYWRLLEMSTTPGSTALTAACCLPLLTPVPGFVPLPLPNGLPGPLLPGFGVRPGFGDACDSGAALRFSTPATTPGPAPPATPAT